MKQDRIDTVVAICIIDFKYNITAMYTIQIVTKVSILSCFMPFLAYRDKMRAEGPNHYPYILGMA